MEYVDKGLNDAWVLPEHVTATAPGRYSIALKEPLGQDWDRQIARYPLPGAEPGTPARVTCGGEAVPCQWDGDKLALRVEGLRAGEARVYEVILGESGDEATPGVTVETTPEGGVVDNGAMALLLPASAEGGLASPLPGPLLAVRRGEGSWLG